MFKGYSSKSAALKGATRAGIASDAVYLGDCNGEMKWGFLVSEDAASPTETTSEAPTADSVATDEGAAPADDGQAEFDAAVREVLKADGLNTDPTKDADEPEDDGSDEPVGVFPQASAGMFSGMASQLASVGSTAPVASSSTSVRTAYKIEKDRPMQNGIKRPSAGGMCRAVWDWCDTVRESKGGEPPVSTEVREHAPTVGWNLNNAMIEFYNWRRYNGITGRAAKAAPVAA